MVSAKHAVVLNFPNVNLSFRDFFPEKCRVVKTMKKLFFLSLFLPLYLIADVVSLDINEFEKSIKNRTYVVDIRTPEEWKQTGIIENSVPLTFFNSDGSYNVSAFIQKLKKMGIDKNRPLILVCRSATRTKMVGDFLSNKLGYKKVYQLKGGILNWIAHNKPLIRYR